MAINVLNNMGRCVVFVALLILMQYYFTEDVC